MSERKPDLQVSAYELSDALPLPEITSSSSPEYPAYMTPVHEVQAILRAEGVSPESEARVVGIVAECAGRAEGLREGGVMWRRAYERKCRACERRERD